jgi:hypothetical protein
MEEQYGLKTIVAVKELHFNLPYLGNQIKNSIKLVKELEQNISSSSNNNIINI